MRFHPVVTTLGDFQAITDQDTKGDLRYSLATVPAEKTKVAENIWRRGRDLNSRMSYPISGFQDRHVRPLRHPSDLIFQAVTRLCIFDGWIQGGLDLRPPPPSWTGRRAHSVRASLNSTTRRVPGPFVNRLRSRLIASQMYAVRYGP